LGLSISQPLTDLVKEVAIAARRRDANTYSLINLGFNPTIWHFCFFFFKKANQKKKPQIMMEEWKDHVAKFFRDGWASGSEL
jgi:hypothetical protein